MMWLAVMTTTLGDREEAFRLWRQTDELGAARSLCAAISRLGLGQNEPLAEWYRNRYTDAKVPASLKGMPPLLEGVLDPERRDDAIEWLRGIERQVDPAFVITHYALLGDVEGAYRIAADYDLVDDSFYLYQL